MKYLDTFLEAYRLTDTILEKRNIGKGKVDLYSYLYEGNVYAFTSKNKNEFGKSARDLIVEANKDCENNFHEIILKEVVSKILENAALCLKEGITKTDNIILNALIKKAITDIKDNKFNGDEINIIIKYLIENLKNSNHLYKALINDIKALEFSFDLNKEAELLDNYNNILNPNIENNIVFQTYNIKK